jgi:hypothetical protein
LTPRTLLSRRTPGKLSLELPALEAIIIVRQGGAQEGVANFNLVQMVGCLTPADKGWKLTSATEPVVTKEEASTPAALAKAGGQPLGQFDFELVSVIPAYQPIAVNVPMTDRMERLIRRFAAICDPVVHLPVPGIQCAKSMLHAIAYAAP